MLLLGKLKNVLLMSIAIKVEKPLSYISVPDSHQEGEGTIVLHLRLLF